MSYGVGNPEGMRMCAGVLEVQARRLEHEAKTVVSRMAEMEYVGRTASELRRAAAGDAGLLASNAAILRAQAKIIKATADQVQREQDVLRQRALEEARRAQKRQGS